MCVWSDDRDLRPRPRPDSDPVGADPLDEDLDHISEEEMAEANNFSDSDASDGEASCDEATKTQHAHATSRRA